MKNIYEINRMIEEILELPRIDSKTKKSLPSSVLNARRKKIKFYNLCKRYIETKPTEKFLRAELDRLNSKLITIGNTYPIDKKFATIAAEKEFKKEFNREWEIPKIKEQIKTLKFILKSNIG